MSTGLAYIPDWRADETLYSWVAGFHATLGNGSARDTGTMLFGARHACKERDAPTNLQHFVDVTDGTLGSVQSLIRTRSPIGLFIPFLPEHRQRILDDRFCKPDGIGWRTLCGMPASCLAAPHSLHYCEVCVAEDIARWGLPRWRLPHQLVGSWICLEHGCALRTFQSTASQWHLPPTEPLAHSTQPFAPGQVEALRGMAMLAMRLIGSAPLDIESIRQAVLVGLRDQGITTWTYPLDASQLASWFSQDPIAAWLRASSGPWHPLASGTWIHALLRNRVGDHPLKWMLLWSALFADADPAFSHQRFLDPEATPHWDPSGQGSIWGTSSSALPLDIQKIIREAPTLKDAASSLGLTVHTLRRRMAELGTNARVFRFDTSLEHRRSRAVTSISTYIESHPKCTRADIHRDCKAAVSWIRANDPTMFSVAVEAIDNQHSRQLPLIS